MFSTPLASTAIVRPPAARAPAMGRPSMPRARPLTIVSPARARLPASRSACASRTAWRAACPRWRCPAVLRLDLAPHEQHPGRIGNVLDAAGYWACSSVMIETPWALAEVDLGGRIDFVFCPQTDLPGASLGPMPGTVRRSLGAAANTAVAVPNRSSRALRSKGPMPENSARRTASSSWSGSSGALTGAVRTSGFDRWTTR